MEAMNKHDNAYATSWAVSSSRFCKSHRVTPSSVSCTFPHETEYKCQQMLKILQNQEGENHHLEEIRGKIFTCYHSKGRVQGKQVVSKRGTIRVWTCRSRLRELKISIKGNREEGKK